MIARVEGAARDEFRMPTLALVLAALVVLIVGSNVGSGVSLAAPRSAKQRRAGSIVALDSSSGEQCWFVEGGNGHELGYPVVTDGTLVFTQEYLGPCIEDALQRLRPTVLDASDGRRRWNGPSSEGRMLFTDPPGSGVAIVQVGREVQGLDAKTDALHWTIPSDGVYPSIAPSPNLVLVRDAAAAPSFANPPPVSRDVRTYDRRSGALRWTFATDTIEADGGPYVVAADARVVVLSDHRVLDTSTGMQRFPTTARPDRATRPQVSSLPRC